MNIRDYIKERKCLMDGAMGTYYEDLFQTAEQPELANQLYPDRIFQIHKEYLEAGAVAIRTNTFASNMRNLHTDLEGVKKNITAAYRIATEAISAYKDRFVFCDMGPIAYDNWSEMTVVAEEHLGIVKHFYELGGRNFVFETMSSVEGLEEAIAYLKEKNDTYLMINFNVNQFGFGSAGLSLRYLLQEAVKLGADCAGCNCGIGSGHMRRVVERNGIPKNCQFSVLPNAGYPKRVRNRIVFEPNTEKYFAENCAEMMKAGVDFIGGCCGTTPKTIRELAGVIDLKQNNKAQSEVINPEKAERVSPHAFWNKDKDKLIAVELAPPFNPDDTKLLEAAHMLRKSGVDILTFPDSPSGRMRIDPILMAEKVYRETNIPVMPHICCRDKNAIAICAQLLGAQINDIHNFLVVTGDSVNVQSRDSVKSVFQFDSIGLMKVAKNVNEELLQDDPICYGGAINQGRRNLDVEIQRVKKKMETGATFFLTQPVCSEESIERLRQIKEETDARILCGIMPFVSRKNASFMKNEISGIEVPNTLIERYPENGTKEEGEAVGVAFAKEMIARTEDFVDGYYFSFPFNRVYLLEQILG